MRASKEYLWGSTKSSKPKCNFLSFRHFFKTYRFKTNHISISVGFGFWGKLNEFFGLLLPFKFSPCVPLWWGLGGDPMGVEFSPLFPLPYHHRKTHWLELGG